MLAVVDAIPEAASRITYPAFQSWPHGHELALGQGLGPARPRVAVLLPQRIATTSTP